MKLTFATIGEAQAFADKVHASMIATNPAYAKSVERGQTKQWDTPRTDDGGTTYYIIVKDRCDSVLTPAEKAARTLTVVESKL